MQTCYIMIGIAGAGKSTFCKRLVEKGIIHISRDDIRNKMHKDTGKNNENKVKKEVMKQLQDNIEAGKNVVIDSTNISRNKRQIYFKQSYLKDVQKVAIFLDVDTATCLKQNAQRKGIAKVPNIVIYTMAKNLDIPTTEEGFDKVIIIRKGENENKLDLLN